MDFSWLSANPGLTFLALYGQERLKPNGELVDVLHVSEGRDILSHFFSELYSKSNFIICESVANLFFLLLYINQNLILLQKTNI